MRYRFGKRFQRPGAAPAAMVSCLLGAVLLSLTVDGDKGEIERPEANTNVSRAFDLTARADLEDTVALPEDTTLTRRAGG